MASIADTKPLLRRAGLEPVISASTLYERFFKTGSVDAHSFFFTSALDHHTPSPMPCEVANCTEMATFKWKMALKSSYFTRNSQQKRDKTSPIRQQKRPECVRNLYKWAQKSNNGLKSHQTCNI